MTLRFRADVSIADTEYGTVLLDERSGRYWQLNPTGVLVVRALMDGKSADEAVVALTEEYQVGQTRARQDVTALLHRLCSAGLVSR
ncbi:lasso peptide biosynthesis PqqD family chaperone [Amycolatopsis anabasis]|uniref:lasso peptide biosynthesis PqqD family chaperone n=1 Tax=Amycolatopsis anabasis TaxID=1840409 RepID=UPI00131CB04B|nr:lasso peptide biosynthesis PqqD family chaperone [Amycolatopsis anabasis]